MKLEHGIGLAKAEAVAVEDRMFAGLGHEDHRVPRGTGGAEVLGVL